MSCGSLELSYNFVILEPPFSPSTFSSSASWILVIVSDIMLLRLLNMTVTISDKMTGNTWTDCDNFFQFLFQRGSVHNKTDRDQRN